MPTPLSWYTEAAAILRRERTKMTDEPTDHPADQAEPRTAAGQIRQERIERHQRGDHEWQPGPYIKIYQEPADLVLVCRCGAMIRRTIPSRAEAATPAVDVEADIRRATVERIRSTVRAILDEEAAR